MSGNEKSVDVERKHVREKNGNEYDRSVATITLENGDKVIAERHANINGTGKSETMIEVNGKAVSGTYDAATDKGRVGAHQGNTQDANVAKSMDAALAKILEGKFTASEAQALVSARAKVEGSMVDKNLSEGAAPKVVQSFKAAEIEGARGK